MLGAVNRLGVGVKKALSQFAVGSKEPALGFDFVDNTYLANGTKNLSQAITHSRSGNATMTDGYGPELVTNGDFSTDSDWTLGDGWSIADGVLSTDGSMASYTSAQQNAVTVSGKMYVATFKLDMQSGALDFKGSGVYKQLYSSDSGFVTVVFQADSANVRFTTNAAIASIDNVSVREMPAIKWGPHNLLTYSEDFSNAAWVKLSQSGTPIANDTLAPDGSITADKIVDNNAGGTGIVQLSQSVTVQDDVLQTASVFLKADGLQWGAIYIINANASSGEFAAYFDLQNGVVGSSSGTVVPESHTITSVGNGWYLCSVSWVQGVGATSPQFRIRLASDDLDGTVDLDGTSSVYAWGAHLYRSDLGGMVDNPERGDSYVPTAARPYGPELVTNGTFDSDLSGWTVSAGQWAWANGAAVGTATGGVYSELRQDVSTVSGNVYTMTVDVSNVVGLSSSDIVIDFGTESVSVPTEGTLTLTTVASSSSTLLRFRITTSSETDDSITIDNVSVRQSSVDPSAARYLPRVGHHVYNGTAWADEGVLHESEARTNLALYSNEFDNGYWAGSSPSTTVSLSAIPSPDGTPAYKITGSAGNNYRIADAVVSNNQTKSIYARTVSGTGTAHILAHNTVAESLVTLTEEWQRFSLPSDTSETGGSNFYLVDFRGSNTLTEILVYGAQLEAAATPSSYIPTSGSTVTRAADSLVIPSANLPWPTPQYIGPELVTNGTFDTDTGWLKTGTVTISGGEANIVSDGSYQYIAQPNVLEVGKVYEVTFDITSVDSGSLKVSTSFNTAPIFSAAGTYSFVGTAKATTLYFERNSACDITIDNVSVREINPLSVSIQMDGRMTYADEGIASVITLANWELDASNKIFIDLDTDGASTGEVNFNQTALGIADRVVGPETSYSPSVLVPYNIASRHGSTFVNGAIDGVALTADTTLVALPDLSATDLDLGFDYMGTINQFRVWSQDLGDTGIVEATEPSLEPSLSLTFDSTDSSFIVRDFT